MKRILCLLLCAVLMIGLFVGCGESGETEQTGGGETLSGFSVGYGKADISPEKSVYLIGYGEPKAERMSTGVSDRLYATATAFTDEEGETVLFIACDLLFVLKAQSDPLRELIAKETGVPFDHIIVHSSHNHSGPDPSDPAYYILLQERVLNAAKDAMADRAPAQMFTAFSRPEGYNTVRHYLLVDGTYMGEGVGAVEKNELVGHTHKADNLLQLVKFTREGKKDIVMMNWQGHPRSTAPYSHTTSTCNYAGIMRQTVEEQLDCLGSFVLSGSGNLNCNSQIAGEVKPADYLELGKALGEEAVKAAATFKPAKTDNIQLEENIYLHDSVKWGADSKVPLYAFSIGEVAFATAPFEVFDTNAVFVKENSKFKMTFYASVTSDWQSYLPTPQSFPWENHYEVRITYYPQGMAEDVADELVAMLDRLFAAGGYEETEKEPGYITPEFVPVSDGVEYMNPTPGDLTAYREVANGFYQLTLLKDGRVKMMLAKDKAAAEKVLAQTNMKLLFDEQNLIVDVAP